MIKQDSGTIDVPSRYRILSTIGVFIAVFSLVMSILVLFVIPIGCTFVGSLQLVLLGSLFLVGVFTLIIGKVLQHKKGKVQAGSGGSLKQPPAIPQVP